MSNSDEQVLSEHITGLGNVFIPEYWSSPTFPTLQRSLPSLGTNPTNDDLLWYRTLLVAKDNETSDEEFVSDAIFESGGRYTARDVPGFRICRSYIKEHRLTYGKIYVKGDSQHGMAMYKAVYKLITQNMLRQRRGFYISRDLDAYCAANDAEPFPAHAAVSFKIR